MMRFYTLDSIRGFAALVVVAYHSGAFGAMGFLAVDLFFVLSGFVIAMSYSEKLEQGLGVTGFMTLRLERLYPLWLLGCLVAVIYFLTQGVATTAPKWFAGITVANILMLPAPSERSIFPLNIPGWSLFFELLVNFAFALGLWRLRNTTLAVIMVAAGAVLMVMVMVTPPHSFNMGSEWSAFFGGFPRTLYSFLAGVLIFRLGAATRRRSTWLSCIPVALVSIILCLAPPTAMLAGAQGVSVLLLFPLLVWLAVRWELPPVLEKVAKHLGDISYPLYVLHVPLVFVGDAAKKWTGSAEAALLIYVSSLVFLAWPAAVADRVVRAWIRKLRLSRSAPSRQAAV